MKLLTRKLRIERMFDALRKSLPDSDFRLEHMRGSLDSRFLLVAPPPDAEEYQKATPFSNSAACWFHTALLEETGLNTDKHFLVIASSLFGAKPSKSSFLFTREFVESCARHHLFNAYVAVGKLCFSSIFGDRKVTSPYQPGVTLYPSSLVSLKHNPVPLLVCPNIDPLIITAEDGTRDAYIQLRAQSHLRSYLRGILFPRLKKLHHENTV